MDTSREDVGIAIRSAFLAKGSKQKFSLFILVLLSIVLLFFETIDTKPLNYFRAFIKDVIYRGALVVSVPSKSINNFTDFVKEHTILYDDYIKLKKENSELKNKISDTHFLKLENTQLRKLIEEQVSSPSNLMSARVMLDKQSPYLNSFIINIGSNKKIKKGMAVLGGKNFIGRVVDVNFFSSRVLLISDLNSKIPVGIEPGNIQSILSGTGKQNGKIEYLETDILIKDKSIVYTSGSGGLFKSGIPVGIYHKETEEEYEVVHFFSKLSQLTFVKLVSFEEGSN